MNPNPSVIEASARVGPAVRVVEEIQSLAVRKKKQATTTVRTTTRRISFSERPTANAYAARRHRVEHCETNADDPELELDLLDILEKNFSDIFR